MDNNKQIQPAIDTDTIRGEVYAPWYFKLVWLAVLVWGCIQMAQYIQTTRQGPDDIAFSVISFILVSAFILWLLLTLMTRISYDSKTIRYSRPLRRPERYNWKEVIAVSPSIYSFRIKLTRGRSFLVPFNIEGDREFLDHAKRVLKQHPIKHLRQKTGQIEKPIGYYWVYVACTALIPGGLFPFMDFSDSQMTFYYVFMLILCLLLNFPWISVARKIEVFPNRVAWTTMTGKEEVVSFKQVSEVSHAMILPPNLINPIKIHLWNGTEKSIHIANSSAGKEVFDMLRYHIQNRLKS